MNDRIMALILENNGEIRRKDGDVLEAVFPESSVEQNVSVFFEITDRLEYRAVLTGGNRLVVYTGEDGL